MSYQVWTKEDFGDLWKQTWCEDIETAKLELNKAIRAGGDPILTQELYYQVSIKLTEVKIETKKDKAEPDQDPGSESHGKVRRGDKGATPELDQGSRGNGAHPSAGD